MHLLTAPAKAVENQSQRGESLRLTQRGDRACVERCINQCRATLAACEGGGNNRSVCRTQFQICARRCVVSCGGR